jgi:hypothetical protein
MFLHELAHLTDTKYMLPDAIPPAALAARGKNECF